MQHPISGYQLHFGTSIWAKSDTKNLSDTKWYPDNKLWNWATKVDDCVGVDGSCVDVLMCWCVDDCVDDCVDLVSMCQWLCWCVDLSRQSFVLMSELERWGFGAGKGHKLNRKTFSRKKHRKKDGKPTKLKEPTAKTQRFQRNLCLCRLLSKVI
jgi:hypothetical protein